MGTSYSEANKGKNDNKQAVGSNAKLNFKSDKSHIISKRISANQNSSDRHSFDLKNVGKQEILNQWLQLVSDINEDKSKKQHSRMGRQTEVIDVSKELQFHKKKSYSSEHEVVQERRFSVDEQEIIENKLEPKSNQMQLSRLGVNRRGEHEQHSCETILEEELSSNLEILDEIVEKNLRYERTLNELQNLLREFAIDEKVGNEEFQILVKKYSERDEMLQSRFMPLIRKIQQKIYNRITKEINELIESKLRIPTEILNINDEECDMLSKIETISEELREKAIKINRLQEQMNQQHSMFEEAKCKMEGFEIENEHYELKLREIREEKEKIEKKISVYRKALHRYKERKKDLMQGFSSEISYRNSQQID